MKFKKKPVIIEAEQFKYIRDAWGWHGHMVPGMRPATTFLEKVKDLWKGFPHYYVDTLEGKHSVTQDDWIIKGVKGEYYPCKPDIFEMTYEACEPT